MSYEHGTTHYNLPLTEGSDKRDWFDTNQAFTDIDAAIYSASEAASAASADVAVITSDLSALTTRVTDAEADIDNLEATQSTQGEQMILLANEVSTIETRTGNKFNSVAVKDAYSPTSTYSVGDYVTYDGNLYECDVAITTGEPFDADKWHAVDLMTLIEGGSGGATIDDTTTSTASCWSSSKTNTEITKARTGDVRFSGGKLQQYNGTTWVDISIGGGSMNIDFTNKLFEASSGNTSYTPTANCYAIVGVAAGTANAPHKVSVRGTEVLIAAGSSGNFVSLSEIIPLRSGDTIELNSFDASLTTLVVYGSY